MTDEEAELRAAEYVLGTLDAEERRRIAHDLAHDAGLRRRVADWQRRLTPLAEAAPPEAVPPGLWPAIAAGLAIIDERPNPSLTVRAAAGEWQNAAQGVAMKLLSVDDAAGMQSFLLRLSPGSRLPPHYHGTDEECLVLEGELVIGELRLAAGDYHLARKGGEHDSITAPHGALVFVRAAIEGSPS